MSWYISFYCATRNKKTKMLYPLGPFDNKGKYYDVLCKSRTSHIWDQNEGEIEKAKLEEVSEELRTALKPETYENYFTEEEYGRYGGWIYILPYHELGASNYIKKGYVLLEDLERSEDENSWFDGFSDVLTPVTYAKRLENEMKFGPPKPQKDCEGYDITPHSVADYTYHCWPDYDSLEWETHCIRQFMEMFLEHPGLPDDFEPVIVITQG